MEYKIYNQELEDLLDSSTINSGRCAMICFSGKLKERNLIKKLFHWILKKVTKSWMTHVSILFSDNKDKKWCFESTQPVTQINDFKWCRLPYHEFIIYKLPKIKQSEHITIIKRMAKQYIGQKYGMWQLFGALIARLFKFKLNVFGFLTEQVCSELALEYLSRTYLVDKIKSLNKDIVSPQGIHDALREEFGNSLEYRVQEK